MILAKGERNLLEDLRIRLPLEANTGVSIKR